jgi:toxin ParE1/3/4
MIVVITAEAEADLESIGDHTAKDNPARAASFIRELRGQCMELADIPHAFPLVPRYEHYGIRRRVHGNYLIFYRLDPDSLIVLYVLHGMMDYASILFPV